MRIPGRSLLVRPAHVATTPPIPSLVLSLQSVQNIVVTKVRTISAVLLPRLVVWTQRYLIALSLTFLFMFVTNSTVRSGLADMLSYPFRRLFKGKRNGPEEDRNIHADHSDFYYNGGSGDKDTPTTAQQITVTGNGYNTVAKELELQVEVQKQPDIAVVINQEKEPAIVDEIAWAKKKRDELEASRKAALERGRIREEATRRAELETAKEAERKQIQLAKKAKQQAENDARMKRRKEEEAMALKRQEAEELAKKQRREAEKAAALRRVAELRQQEINDMLLTKMRIEEQAKAQAAERVIADALAKEIALSKLAAAAAEAEAAAASVVTVVKTNPISSKPASTVTAAAVPPTPKPKVESMGVKKEFTYNPNVPNFDGSLSPANSASLLKNSGVVKVADIQIRQEITTSTAESGSEINNVVRSISSLYDKFLGNLVHELTPQNELPHIQNEDSSVNSVSSVSVASGAGDDDGASVSVGSGGSEHDAETSLAAVETRNVESRNYSPFQESEKAAAFRKEAQEANVRRLRQQEMNDTLANKLRIERTVAENKSRSFSPFQGKKSSSPSSALPYSPSKVADDADVISIPVSELGVVNSDINEINQDNQWTPGKVVRQ